MSQAVNTIYNPTLLRRGLMLVLVMLAACKLTGSIAYAAFYPIMLLAFTSQKPERAMLVELLMAAFLCANAYFVPKTAMYGYLQRGGIMLMGVIMFMSVMSRGLSPFMKPLFGILIYIFYMIIPSAVGWSWIVSFLKIFLFILTITAWLGFGNMIIKETHGHVSKIRGAILCYAIFMIMGSFILLPIPSIGQMGMADLTPAEIASKSVVSLFKGMTQHSQALGPVAAMTMVLVLGDYIFGVRRNHYLYNVLLLCGFVVLWRTSSRTALCTMLFGFGVLFLSLTNARMANTKWKTKVQSTFFMVGIVVLAAVFMIPAARNAALRYIVKYNTNDSAVMKHTNLSDITSSRRGAFDNPIANWKKSPAIGNGFQVSIDMSYIKERDVKNLLTAPVEKGTWIVAVLEEGGTFGMIILVVWIICTCVQYGRLRCYIGRAMLLTMLVSNLGEFSMFSLSYIGSIQWVMVVAGVVLDYARLQKERELKVSVANPPTGFIKERRFV